MIKEISLNNLDDLTSSFLSKRTVENDLKTNPFGHYLVYFNSKKDVLGYIYYSDIYDRAEINQIEVKKNDRNNGIGSKLMQELIKSVDKGITLEVNENNISAIKLYKKFDFKEKAIRKGYYNGIDGILMEREN